MKMNRRTLFKGLSTLALPPAFNPVNAIIGSLVAAQTLRSRARAATSGVNNYVYVYCYLGVARWGFDLALNPYAEGAPGTYLRNAGLNNSFQPDGSGNLQPAYQGLPVTVAGTTLSMPPIWQCQLPRPNGSTVPMANLLNNMITMRGINMAADGHPNNAVRQILPSPGAGSLNGLVADASTAPIPAIDLSTETYLNASYESLRGIGLSTWFSSQAATPLQQLLNPFISTSPTSGPAYLTRQQVDAAVESAIGAVQYAASVQNPDSVSLFSSRQSARALLTKSFGNLGGSYNALLAKYRGLMAACAGMQTMVGLNNLPIPTSPIPSQQCNVDMGGATGTVVSSDLRTMITPTSIVTLLAEGFATSEYMLTNGLASASLVTAGPTTGLNLQVPGQAATFTHNPDEHVTGTAVSVVITSFYWRCLAACLYEFINQLQSAGLFNNTVIQLGSEFSRAPRVDGSGADHNFEGAVTSVLSGQITSPCIVGDCFVQASTDYTGNPTYAGTFGGGAPMSIGGVTTSLNIGNVTSTVADLLGVARPASNFPPVFNVTSSGVSPNVEKARNV